jgi:proteasome lid subunit RPN8/RPN11
LINDIRLVEQDCTSVTVAFRDSAIADFFDEQVDAGQRPETFGRCWVHTHPGNCPFPSRTDEETFARVFGRADWAVMFIIARSGDTYARLRFNTGPGGEIELSTTIDYQAEFLASEREAWEQEFLKSVHDTTTVSSHLMDADLFGYRDPWGEDWYDDWLQYTEGDSDSLPLKVVNHE